MDNAKIVIDSVQRILNEKKEIIRDIANKATNVHVLELAEHAYMIIDIIQTEFNLVKEFVK